MWVLVGQRLVKTSLSHTFLALTRPCFCGTLFKLFMHGFLYVKFAFTNFFKYSGLLNALLKSF